MRSLKVEEFLADNGAKHCFALGCGPAEREVSRSVGRMLFLSTFTAPQRPDPSSVALADRGFHFHSVFGSDDVLSKYVGEFGGLKFVVDAKLVSSTVSERDLCAPCS